MEGYETSMPSRMVKKSAGFVLPSLHVLGLGMAAIALVLLALYPLRMVQRVSAEIPVYRQRAAAWDLRETEIAALKAQGEQDLVVRFLPEEISQDLGDRTGFRLNRCAAILYGVNSIIAVPMDELSE